MKQDIAVTLERDMCDGYSCLSYTIKPSVKQQTIQLVPGIRKHTELYSTNDLILSHVQVHVATSNDLVSIGEWLFPPGNPRESAIRAIYVEIYQRRFEVVGGVFYTDGSETTSIQKLDKFGRQCP